MPEPGETPAGSAAELLTVALQVLDRLLGFGKSVREGVSMLGDGTPIPMMSYSLIEYLMSLDLTGMDVLEVGGGQSTRFWAARARSVVTLDHDPHWLPEARDFGNLTVVLVARDEFPKAIRKQPEPFDLIVIDCGASRYDCAIACTNKLRPGGAVLLDNSEWYPQTAALLRERDLIQVDFADFRPGHHGRGTSSLFLHRDFRPVPLGPALPPVPIGGEAALGNLWDRPGWMSPPLPTPSTPEPG